MKIKFLGIITIILLIAAGSVMAAKPNKQCNTIQSGQIHYPSDYYLGDKPITTGFDEYGWNYQAHSFEGYFANYAFDAFGLPPYEGNEEAYYQRLVDEGFASNINEAMNFMYGDYFRSFFWINRDISYSLKWNDEYKSNKDCNGDGLIDFTDRYSNVSYFVGTGAWITEKQRGTYFDDSGKKCSFIYFAKHIAVPKNAYEENDEWYTVGNQLIGPSVYLGYGLATIQQVINDSCGGCHGIYYKTQISPGLGYWK